MNDVIRKARETEVIRARLIDAEQSGFTRLSHQQIRAEIRAGIRAADNGEFASDTEMNRILGKHGSD